MSLSNRKEGIELIYSAQEHEKTVILSPWHENTMDMMDSYARIFDSMTHKEFVYPKELLLADGSKSKSRVERIIRGCRFDHSEITTAIDMLVAAGEKGRVKLNSFILSNQALNPDCAYYKDVVRPHIDEPERVEPLMRQYRKRLGSNAHRDMWAKGELMVSLTKHDINIDYKVLNPKYDTTKGSTSAQIEVPYEPIDKVMERMSMLLICYGMSMEAQFE